MINILIIKPLKLIYMIHLML